MTTTHWLLLALVGVAVLVDIWLVLTIRQADAAPATRLRWTLLVVLLPLVGWIIWARLGPRGLAKAPSSPEHSKG